MKTIAVYHNKGGVGKTTTVVNLAAAFRKQGKRVLIIDLDSQANTTFATGLFKLDDEELDDIRNSNIYHVLRYINSYSISDVARKSIFNSPEIDVVPAHISLMKVETELNCLRMRHTTLLTKLMLVEDQYDIVLIDTPPSFNLFAEIALVTSDYLIIPSDLKPFANQGLLNVKEFVEEIDEFRKQRISKLPIKILGVLPSKISTNAQFVQFTLPRRRSIIRQRYGFNIMENIIYEREDLAKSIEKTEIQGDRERPNPQSVLDFSPRSQSTMEFKLLAIEVLQKIGMA